MSKRHSLHEVFKNFNDQLVQEFIKQKQQGTFLSLTRRGGFRVANWDPPRRVRFVGPA